MKKEALKILVPSLILVGLAFALAYRFIQPAPPRELTLAAGPAGGAYLVMAQRYRDVLAEAGVTVHIRESAGSVENVAWLVDPDAGVDVGLVQTGMVIPEDSGIEGLAALAYEPMWLFTVSEQPLRMIPELRGQRVAIGAVGSGTRPVVLAILAEHGLELDDLQAVDTGAGDVLAALDAGNLDAVFTVGSVQSAAVQALLAREDLALAMLDLAPALGRRLPFLDVVTLPRGVLDPARDSPPEPIQLLAPVASLVARSDLHPALVDLLLMAARQVHGDGDLLSLPGTFPSPYPVAAPLSSEAHRFFNDGLPFLKRVLPFWAATLVSRAWVMVIPLLTILIPLMKVLPPTYHWRLRSQIFRLYRRLKVVDRKRIESGADTDIHELLVDVDAIDKETEQLTVPLSYADRVYTLKLHIRFVRDQLAGGGA